MKEWRERVSCGQGGTRLFDGGAVEETRVAFIQTGRGYLHDDMM